MRLWLRRLTTRLLAVTPAVIVLHVAGDKATFQLLLLSQVILSLQLPFAVIPLLHFTGDRRRMGLFANPRWVRLAGWLVAIIIVWLNMRLATNTISEWLTLSPWLGVPVAAAAACLLLLLLWITLEPVLPVSLRGKPRLKALPPAVDTALTAPAYKRILVPLDHSELDHETLVHAAAMAKLQSATLYLLHVEEGVTSQLYGQQAATSEVEEGQQYFNQIVEALTHQSIHTELRIHHSNDPADEIVRVALELKPDLIIMGAHGHKGIKDLMLGTTISAVRHALSIPVLVVTKRTL
jgi:manganese transport protein